MRKLLAAFLMAFGVASAQFSVESLKPSLAAIGGTQGFGLEALLALPALPAPGGRGAPGPGPGL
jgi:hypothetical protein